MYDKNQLLTFSIETLLHDRMKRLTTTLLTVWLLFVLGNELLHPSQAAEVPLVPVPEEILSSPPISQQQEMDDSEYEEEIRKEAEIEKLFGSTSSEYLDSMDWEMDDDEGFLYYYQKEREEVKKETLSEEIDQVIRELEEEERKDFEKNFVFVGVKGDFVVTKFRVCILLDDVKNVKEMLDTFSKERLFPVGEQSPFLIPMSIPMQHILTSYFEARDDTESIFLLNMGQLLEYTKQLEYKNLVRHVYEDNQEKVLEMINKFDKSK